MDSEGDLPGAGYEVRQATDADVPAVGALYAAAFESNPAYRFLFNGSTDAPPPPGALQWLFERRAALLLLCGCPLLLLCPRAAPGEVLAAGGLVPYSRKPGMVQMARAGILTWPLRWGFGSLTRGLQLDAHLKALTQPGGLLEGRGVGGELVLMAVAPGWQGRGLGGRLLAALVRLWDAQFGGEGGLLLATQLPAALHLYRKAGFQTIKIEGQEERPHPDGGFPNWLLLRPAEAATAADGGSGG